MLCDRMKTATHHRKYVKRFRLFYFILCPHILNLEERLMLWLGRTGDGNGFKNMKFYLLAYRRLTVQYRNCMQEHVVAKDPHL